MRTPALGGLHRDGELPTRGNLRFQVATSRWPRRDRLRNDARLRGPGDRHGNGKGTRANRSSRGREPDGFSQTLPEENASTSILKKLGFRLVGTVEHPEDGPVWEWELPAEQLKG